MEEIKEDIELCEFDGCGAVNVYIGGFENLEKCEIKWRNANKETCEALSMKEVHLLKLSEIVEQANSTMITIFIDEPLRGEIWQYGNYGDSWWKIGETCGYA